MVADTHDRRAYGSRAADSSYAADAWSRAWKRERDMRSWEGQAVAARHEDQERNNGFFSAMVQAIVQGVIGAKGLQFSSLYEIDSDGEKSADTMRREFGARRMIEKEIAKATSGTRFDASGMWSLRDQLEIMLRSSITTGPGIGIRVWKPDRAGRPYTGWCLRTIHTSRVSNPNLGPNTNRLRDGFELDADGDPVAVWISNRNDSAISMPSKWTRIPIWGPDGLRNVLIYQRPGHPDALMSWGWMRPILPLMHQLGETIDSYVVGKRMASMFPIIIKTSNRALLNRAAAANRLVAPGLVMRPGEVYIQDDSTELEIPQWSFNGDDVKSFNDALMEIACAAIGLPKAVVLRQLDDANLAAARAALADAYRTFQMHINRMATHVMQPIHEWIVSEGIARGRLDLDGDIDTLTAGEFHGPSMSTPDWFKDVKAAVSLVHELGVSPETAFDKLGLDFEDEVLRRAVNEMLAEMNGVGIGVMGGKPAQQSGQSTSTPDDDEEDD